MYHHRVTAALFSFCASVLLTVPSADAQTREGPVKKRVQEKIQSEVQKQSGQARAQIEAQVQSQIAARLSPAEMAKVGQVQTALNYFTFDAGPVDGLMGQKTQGAIKEYQAYLDYPVTGTLAEAEAQFLMAAYQGAQANSAQAQQVAATHPDGIKGMLLIVRDGAPSQTAGLMPSFGNATAPQDLAAFCAPSAAAPASMDGALRPIFCGAAEAAMAQSDVLSAGIVGFTPAQIEAQCLAFAPALEPLVASLSGSPAADVIQGATGFVETSGQDPAAMLGIAKVCLGIGYRKDEYSLALGSAVILTALDAPTYAEFPGYHLALGYGAAKDPALARTWFEGAMAPGAAPKSEFEVQAAERLQSVQSAAAQGAGASAIPSFSVNQ